MNVKQAEGARRRRSRAEVEQLVAEYEASGLGRQEFCDKHGLSLSTLNRHRKRRQVATERATPGRLLPVEISQAKQHNGSERCGELLVRLSSGRRIEVRAGFDAKEVKLLYGRAERSAAYLLDYADTVIGVNDLVANLEGLIHREAPANWGVRRTTTSHRYYPLLSRICPSARLSGPPGHSLPAIRHSPCTGWPEL